MRRGRPIRHQNHNVVPLQFFRFYLGSYGPQWPDYKVSRDPTASMVGSRVHMSRECQSLAASCESALPSSQEPPRFLPNVSGSGCC